jgi:fibronectin type 3 domain-containing protein
VTRLTPHAGRLRLPQRFRLGQLLAAGVVVLAIASTPAAVLDAEAAATAPVAAFAFAEGSGVVVADASGNGNTGSVVTASWTTQGRFGSALSFNGSDSLVNVPDAPELRLGNAMTLEAWVNPTTVNSAWRDVIYKGNDNYYLSGTSGNSGRPVGGGIFNGGYREAYGAGALAANTWTHLATTYDGSNLRLYVNGTQVASQPATGTLAGSANPLQIGGDSIYGQHFNGRIDEVRVYNTALTATEIQTDMNTPVDNSGPPDTQPPTAPATANATAISATRIDLTWSPASDNIAVTGYRIERCQGSTCTNFTEIDTSTQTSYSNTGLQPSTPYRYRIRATDAATNLGPYSPTTNATTQAPPPDGQPPTAPATLDAVAVSSNRIDVTWSAATDNVAVTEYRLERCQGTNCTTFAEIAAPTQSSYGDIGLQASSSYSYRVRAVDAAGNLGPYSPTDAATTQPPPDGQPPTAPATLNATAVSSSQIDLTWSAATDNVGVAGYRVERCQGAGCTIFAVVASPTQTSYSDLGLQASTSYSYRVRAVDAATNFGPYSPVAGATTLTASNLVAAYAFGEGAGATVTDASGRGHHGTVSNTTWTSQGRFGSALSFNGSSSLVNVADAPALRLGNAMTLEAWVFPTTVNSAWRDVIYKGNDNYYLSATSSQSARPVGGGIFNGHNRESYGTSALAVNTWTHVATTYDGSALRLYVNGIQVASRPVSGTLAASANPLQIGGDSIYGQFFSGRIDEIRIYNTALSAVQIQTDMNTAVAGGAPLGGQAAISPWSSLSSLIPGA